jgi:hypothetical protein
MATESMWDRIKRLNTLTLKELSRRAGLNENTIQGLKKRTVKDGDKNAVMDAANAEAVASVLGTTKEHLLYGAEDSPVPPGIISSLMDLGYTAQAAARAARAARELSGGPLPDEEWVRNARSLAAFQSGMTDDPVWFTRRVS